MFFLVIYHIFADKIMLKKLGSCSAIQTNFRHIFSSIFCALGWTKSFLTCEPLLEKTELQMLFKLPNKQLLQ